MTILYFLVPLALALAAGAIVAFAWAARDRQFDDLEAPAVRMLDDDRDQPPCETTPFAKEPT